LTDNYAANRLYLAAKNMPLPAGRNRPAAEEILRTSRVGCLNGFRGDLLILQANSENPAHDGRPASFHHCRVAKWRPWVVD
jgi:hypothetical protein